MNQLKKTRKTGWRKPCKLRARQASAPPSVAFFLRGPRALSSGTLSRLTHHFGLCLFLWAETREEPKNTRTNNFFTLLYSPVFPLNKTTKKDTGRGPNIFSPKFPLFPLPQPSTRSRFIFPATPNRRFDTESVRPPTRSID
jgi:hypothetical protein